MAVRLSGIPVVREMRRRVQTGVEQLRQIGQIPTMGIVRVGARPEDVSYETGATKLAQSLGIAVSRTLLPGDVGERQLLEALREVNENQRIHGCLLFRPLPAHMDEDAICAALDPAKDVDGITAGSLASVFTGSGAGYPPCTAQACMEILEHYGCDLTGKRAVVVGRSLVVGRPLAMLLLRKNATVTVCHTRTADLPAECRRAEVLIAAAGVANMIGRDHLTPGQLVLDVGINVDQDGNLVGDVDFTAADEIAGAVTPVPGGVGAVTTSVLAAHVLQAAEQIG